MEHATDTEPTGNGEKPCAEIAARRRSVFRSAFFLVLCTIVLFVFILVQGDIRRRQRTVDDAQSYASVLTERIGETGALPLNLELPDDHPPPSCLFRQLNRRDTHLLRQSDERIIAAYSSPVTRVFAPDGRAVLLFTDGRFDVDWLSLDEFDRAQAAQREEIRRLATGAAKENPRLVVPPAP